VDNSFAFDCAVVVAFQPNSFDFFKGCGSLLVVAAVNDSAVKQLLLYRHL